MQVLALTNKTREDSRIFGTIVKSCNQDLYLYQIQSEYHNMTLDPNAINLLT